MSSSADKDKITLQKMIAKDKKNRTKLKEIFGKYNIETKWVA